MGDAVTALERHVLRAHGNDDCRGRLAGLKWG